MQKARFKKSWKWYWIAFIPVQWAVYRLLQNHSVFVEEYYSRGIYPTLSSVLRTLFSWIPFSFGQWLFYLMIAYIIWQVFRLTKKLIRSQKARLAVLGKGLMSFFAYFSIIYLIFNVLWGLNYSREPLQQSLDLTVLEPDQARLEALCRHLINTCNELRENTMKDVEHRNNMSSNTSLFAKAEMSYASASLHYELFKYSSPSIKAVAVPQIMSFAGIGGIYFPFTGEANINTHPPRFKLPFTICHEMAHQLGFASETEANFIAYLVCRSSPDTFFQYSGNLAAMRYSMSALYRIDSMAYRELSKSYSEDIQADLKENREYWQRFRSPFEDISHSINDLFLKANGQEDGVKTYGKMVDLLLADYAVNHALQQ